MKKIILLDVTIIFIYTILSLLLSLFTDLLLTDLFFVGFLALLLTSVIMIGLSRHEMRRAAKEKDGAIKDDHRKSFKWHESLSFNFFVLCVVFFVISLLLAT